MSWLGKSEENKDAALACQTTRWYSAGASRAYYSAFLMAKDVFERNRSKFDYEGFISSNPDWVKKNLRRYAHVTMYPALHAFLNQEGLDALDLKDLTVWKQLFRNRLKADYEPDSISPQEMAICITAMNKILAILKKKGANP